MMEKKIIINLKGGKLQVEESIELIKSMNGVTLGEVKRKIIHEFDKDCPFCQLERKAK